MIKFNHEKFISSRGAPEDTHTHIVSGKRKKKHDLQNTRISNCKFSSSRPVREYSSGNVSITWPGPEVMRIPFHGLENDADIRRNYEWAKGWSIFPRKRCFLFISSLRILRPRWIHKIRKYPRAIKISRSFHFEKFNLYLARIGYTRVFVSSYARR